MPPDESDDDRDDAPDEMPDDVARYAPPLPQDDRLWRHPSEMASAGADPAGTRPGAGPSGPPFGAPGTASIRARGRGLADLRVWLVAGTSALAGAMVTLLILSLGGTFNSSGNSPANSGQVSITVPENPGESEIAMTQALAPSVASVTASGPVSHANGTALVLNGDGHLVTTADTVDGAQDITVTFADGTTSRATVVGIDADDDIAVIKVDRTDLTPIPVGDPSTIQLGARATVLSTAESAAGSSKVAVGLISGLGQQVHFGSGKAMHGLIQANVRLSSVESGAPLVDSKGAVIGLVTKRGQAGGGDTTSDTTSTPSNGATPITQDADQPTDEQGVTIRFAVTIDWVQQVAGDLITQGHVDQVWLGISGGELSDDQVNDVGHDGALVTEVTQDSPAAAAHIEAGDVIISVDGDKVDSMSDLIVGIRDHEPGDAVTIEVMRGGTETKASVTLAPRSDDAD